MIGLMELFNIFGVDFSGIFSWQNVVLLTIGLFWLVFASIQDFKHREVENWWSFSLIAFVLAFRFFWSIENWNIMPLIWGLIGLVVGFILAELFYYARMFAGGDAKLLMALGAILPLGLNSQANLIILLLFLFSLILCGSLYGVVYSLILVFINFREFKIKMKLLFEQYKFIFYGVFFFVFLFILIAFILEYLILYFLAIFLLISIPLLFFAKAVEESSMNKLVKVNELTIGDWLVKPLRLSVKGKVKLIKPYWEGLSEKELNLIQKNYSKKVLVKYGLPFVPAILLAFLLLILFFLI